MTTVAMAGFAQGTPSFVPAWLNDGSPLSDADVSSIVTNIGTQQANPDHILVVIHGLGNSREASTASYNELAPRLVSEFQKSRQKVAVVGIQWNSDVPMGLFTAEANYLDMVARARKVGHWPARQVLLQVQKQYPKAKINIYAHSLGCEVTAATLVPELTYADDIPKSEAFQPTRDIYANMVTLAGSDLDWDVWFKGNVNARETNRRTQLTWMTMSPYVGEADKDETLKLRRMVRGVAAGSALPRMTQQQYDTLFKGRIMMFDNTEIPADHAFTNYYNAARLANIVPAAVFVADPKQPKPKLFTELDEVFAMPDQVTALTPFLDSAHLTTAVYALWRLEKINCGGSQHLSDETLENMARLMVNKPSTVRSACKDSACKTMSQGQWPTEKQLIRAGAPNW